MTETAAEPITVEQTVAIAAPPESVWSFWTDPGRLVEWWGVEAELDPAPGGRFRVVMGEGPVMLGAFLELDPPRRLVFSFGWEHNAPGQALAPGSTTVEVTLTPVDDGTVVVLRHSEMPPSHAADHAKGWAYFVGERLPAACAGAGAA